MLLKRAAAARGAPPCEEDLEGGAEEGDESTVDVWPHVHNCRAPHGERRRPGRAGCIQKKKGCCDVKVS